MSMTIYNNSSENYVQQQKINDTNDFNNLVLEYIKDSQPDGSLQDLLDEMKELSPETPVTMQKLNSALLYSDTTLRNDPDYIDYTTEILDKRTSQLLGLNMLTNTMLNNISRQNDEDKELI